MDVGGGLMGQTSVEFLPNNLYTFTFGYMLFALCVVWPPQAIVGFGLTVPSLLAFWLGSEGQHVVWYHIRRSTATLAAHGLLPLLYCAAFHSYRPRLIDLSFFSLQPPHSYTSLFCTCVWLLGVALGVGMLACACWWRLRGWAHHPITKMMLRYQSPHWERAASAIELEFRRLDKVVARLGHGMVAVTDSWIIASTLYGMHVVFQNDVDLSIVDAVETPSLGSLDRSQVLSIRITSVRRGIEPFVVRINAAMYQDMRLKVQATIRNAANITIRETPTQRFGALFREKVERNPRCRVLDEHRSDTCAGCMSKPVDVKIVHRCARPACTDCFCRPMWCCECMAEWFASTQPPHSPEAWMGGTGQCPSCRATFCVDDVAVIT